MAENTFNYRKRIADILLEEKLDAMGAVLIEGPILLPVLLSKIIRCAE